MGDLACAICLSPACVSAAVAVPCGHSFCGLCLADSIESSLRSSSSPPRCPICRAAISDAAPAVALRSHIAELPSDVSIPSHAVADRRLQAVLRAFRRGTRRTSEHRRRSEEEEEEEEEAEDAPRSAEALGGAASAVFSHPVWDRFRVWLAVFASAMYVLSPIDAVPEAVGFPLGLIDDALVLLWLMWFLWDEARH